MRLSPAPGLRAGDVVALRGTEEDVQGEVIAVLGGDRYKVKWISGLGYRDRVTTVTMAEVRRKPTPGVR